MNVFRKAWCRTFQMGMNVVLPLMPYREPKLLDGINGIVKCLKEHNTDNCILVTDKGIRGLGLTKPLEELLEKEGIKCCVFDDTVANPTIANVEAAREMYLSNGCKAIIAFGGGSSMDCAKGLGARITRPNTSLKKMRGLMKVRKKLPLLIAVPTTAGTGSETTVSAVITDGETHFKYVINDFPLIPEYAALEPDVTLGLPGGLTSTTGMDAMTHSVEAFIGHATTKKTRAAAIESVRLIIENLEKVYKDGSDREARAKMLRASYLGGCAFTRSYVGYVHAVAHSLGGQYGVPHGLANAVLLPHVLEMYGKSAHKKLARLAKAVGLVPESMGTEEAAKAFIAKIKQMNENMNIPTTIKGIKEEDISMMADHADKEGNPLYPVPTLWNKEELEKVYRRVMEK
ncbi:MAG: iron-containing alcohol dehydrogenase [Lachnospiraceae bacterium]|nr:iron-containing alcohol dehydrogenase [Lachnospiraceae bacterium]